MLEFIRFELNYRFNRPATYIYFAILLLMGFLAAATDIVRAGGSGGKVMENAPIVITQLMVVMMIFGTFITSAVMGVPVLRDFEHKTDSMIFTTPISKFDYLSGKFLGSFITIIIITSGLILGIVLGQSVQWPWQDNADRMMEFSMMSYINPYLVFVFPNLLFFSALFFLGGSLGKRMVVVYAQGIILFMGYLVAQTFLAQLDNQALAAMLDPFGFGALEVTTQYWTVSEQNSQLMPFSGYILSNRLIWLGIGLLALVILYVKFDFNLAGNATKKTKSKGQKMAREDNEEVISTPLVQQLFGFSAQLTQLRSLSWFYYKWIIKQLPFTFIVLAGVIFVFIIAFVGAEGSYGIELYMTTSRAVQFIGIFNLFFIIIIVFYTGEIAWKERDVKMNLIYDALPYPSYISLASKFLGMILMSVTLMLVLMFCGILIQLIKGYPNIEWGLYFTELFVDTMGTMILYLMLGLFIQSVINHKFIGFGLMFVFYISMIVMSELGLEHTMFYFGRTGLGGYSEMNDFGHYLQPFSWLNIYWFGFATFLYAVAILFSVRGIDSKLGVRLKLGMQRVNGQVVMAIVFSLVVFAASGAYIYYNTNVLNEYQNSDDRKADQAKYERTLKKYEELTQPKIIGTKLAVDVYPKDRDFKASGYYLLKNKSSDTIRNIHIQESSDDQIETNLSFASGFEIDTAYSNFRYTIYRLDNPLYPGDSIQMNFDVTFTTTGFKEGGSNTDIIFNGTFFNNSYFPSIGYFEGFELSSDDDRKEQDLEPKERMMETDDPRGIAQSLFGDDADKMAFEVTISTDSSQIAIAPGYLQKKWNEADRSYYHYKMDTPMVNFYSIISAEYMVIKDSWQPPVDSLPEVALEIYYHKGHEYNTDKMMHGLKEALTYYTNNFSPYQFRQLRIMEFPKYRTFAQSFANTVPFSEGIGFIQHIKTDDVDLPFYVTAHEVAHQWWGHQVTEAGVKGNAMLSETLSQYSALMVMKQNFPPEIIKEFLKYELNSYLMGRTFEQKKEMPLYQVEGQGYIHYRKGSLVMYALQDYIGEDSVNAALKRFNEDWAFKDAPYPTSKDLITYYRAVTPDSLQYIITDMFETITLFENKTTDAEYSLLPDSTYEVTLTVSTIKYQADSLGSEETQELKDWIDIGVFTESSKGKDSLIYLKKHKITQEENVLALFVGTKPTKAGIDPINKLIDRNPKDNVKTVSEKEEESL